MPNPAMRPGFFERLSGREQIDPLLPNAARQWTVYRLRRHGARLRDEDVHSTATVGLLRVLRTTSGGLWATLRTGHHDDPAPLPLSNVRLVKIDRGGVLLTGLECVDHHDGTEMRRMRWQQTWWCVPVDVPR